MKRHRWGLTVCRDCGLHRTTGASKTNGAVYTEYRKEILCNGARGVLVAHYAGSCVGRHDPIDLTAVDADVLSGARIYFEGGRGVQVKVDRK